MLNRLLRLLSAFLSIITPRVLTRLNQHLVRNSPLLWRSRLAQAGWYAPLACAVMATIGVSLPMTTENLWNVAQVGAAFDGIRVASLVAIGIWAFKQSRVATGELGIEDQSRLAVFNICAVFLLLLPAHAFVATATYRTADVMGDSEFEQAWRFHAGNGFWFGQGFDGRISAEKLAELRLSATVFGISHDEYLGLAESPERDCPNTLPCVVTGEDNRPVGPVIESVLRSIKSSKSMWDDGEGRYFERYVASIPTNIVFALLVAAILALIAQPGYVWRRRFPERGSANTRRRFEIYMPGWLQRIDRRLLRTRPMLWAARAHTFVYHAVTVGFAVIAVILLIWHVVFTDEQILDTLESMFGEESPLFWGSLIFIGAVGPFCWAVALGTRHIPANTIASWRAMIRSFFAACVAIPVLFFSIVILVSEISNVFEDLALPIFFAYIGVVTVVSWCVVRNYLGWRAASGTCLIPLLIGFSLFMMIFLTDIGEKGLSTLFGIVLAVWAAINYFWVSGLLGDSAKRWPLLSVTISVGAIPSVLLLGNVVLGIVIDRNFSEEIAWAVLMTNLALLTLPIYLYGMKHGMTQMIAQRNDPRSE